MALFYRYTTLDALKRRLGITSSDDDPLLTDLIDQASARISAYSRREFVPQVGKIEVDCVFPNAVENVIFLDTDVLEVKTVKAGDTVLTGYELRPAKGAGDRLVFRDQAAPLSDVIEIEGVFGFHTDYAAAWGDSRDTLASAATASTAILFVGDADGTDDRGLPRFTAGSLLRVGDEFMYLFSVDPVNNALSVSRAAQNSTPAAHPAGTPIRVYRQMPDITMASEILAAYLYHARDSANDIIQVVNQALTINADQVARALQIVAPYVRPYWGVG